MTSTQNIITKPENDFWLYNIYVLFENEKYKEIFPKQEMSLNEQYNALTRICLWAFVLMLLFHDVDYISLIPIVIIIAIVIIKINNYLEKENNIEEDKNKNKNNAEMEAEETYNENNFPLNPINVESFYSDLDSIYSNETCRMPTVNNPLMNSQMTDYNIYDVPSACNADDEDIQENIKVNFDHNLFSTTADVFERKNAERQFYTTPNTAVPNNQTEFAMWLYKLPDSAICKGDQSACLRYDDLRTHAK